MVSSTINEWLTGRPKWLQFAAKCLLQVESLNDESISELAVLCQQEANGKFPDIDYSIPANAFDQHDSEEIRLCSIGEITEVNKLAPRKPLNFEKSNIAVVYGQNGSGKSGYVRLLKHVCGARDCTLGKLHQNVFTPEDTTQKAKISFLKNNLTAIYEWAEQGVCDELTSVNIFDTSFGKVFMEGEDEVSYEPPVLSFFSSLIDTNEKVAARLDAEARFYKSKMPHLPSELAGSIGAEWLGKINTKTTTEEIEKYCSLTIANEKELQTVQQRMSEQTPVDKARQLQNKKAHVDIIIQDVQKYLGQLSDENCKRIIAAKKKLILKKSAAKTAAREAFSGIQLDGIGDDVWKELWNAARKYSGELAYKNQDFPVITNDSVCVLCLQPLSEKAKKRFLSFESYIKGETQKQADAAEKEAKQAIDTLLEVTSPDVLKTKIDAAGIEKPEIITALTETFTKLQERLDKLPYLESEDEVITIPQSPTWIGEIREISEGYEELANKYLEDAKQDNREEIKNTLKNLQAKKWLTEQKSAIQEEINRLLALQKIQEAKKTTTSTGLSKKKGDLAETLITDAFVKRFNNELKALGASAKKKYC